MYFNASQDGISKWTCWNYLTAYAKDSFPTNVNFSWLTFKKCLSCYATCEVTSYHIADYVFRMIIVVYVQHKYHTIYYILLDSLSISSYTNVLENINSFWIFHSVTCDLIWWYWKRMFMQCLGKSMQQKNVILQIKAATCKISSSSCYMVSTISLLLSFLVYHHIIIPNDTNLAWLGFLPF